MTFRRGIAILGICWLVAAFLVLGLYKGPKNAVEITIQSNQSEYTLGDSIEIEVTFTAVAKTRLYLGADSSSTLFIGLRAGDGINVDFEDHYDQTALKPGRREDSSAPIVLDEGETHTILIAGLLTTNSLNGELHFDFGEFGTITKPEEYTTFMVGVGFYPTNYDTLDSLEYYSNRIWVSVTLGPPS